MRTVYLYIKSEKGGNNSYNVKRQTSVPRLIDEQEGFQPGWETCY